MERSLAASPTALSMKSGIHFTLIEMLVVIAIIGILASMLMPSLMKSLESANKVLCQNNLKQYGVALNMYLRDNNNYKPPGYVTPLDGYPAYIWWPEFLYPYMGVDIPNHSIRSDWPFACPHSDAKEYVSSTNLFSYVFSYYGMSQGHAAPLTVNLVGNRIASPGKASAFMDGESLNNSSGPQNTINGWQAVRYRHLDMANVVYMDGHTNSFRDPDFLAMGSSFWSSFNANYNKEWAQFWGME